VPLQFLSKLCPHPYPHCPDQSAMPLSDCSILYLLSALFSWCGNGPQCGPCCSQRLLDKIENTMASLAGHWWPGLTPPLLNFLSLCLSPDLHLECLNPSLLSLWLPSVPLYRFNLGISSSRIFPGTLIWIRCLSFIHAFILHFSISARIYVILHLPNSWPSIRK
jgi:hypothetical protein